MATFHENLVQSFKNFKDKYLKANGVTFQFSYDSSTGKFGYKDANGNFIPFRKVQASKTVSPSTSSQTVTPDSGYDGIASVTVNAVNLQSKTISPSSSSQTITPDSSYDGLEQVTVNAVNLQSKTTTMTPPSPSSWSATTTKLGTVTPDSGYTGLSQAEISIPMIPDNTTLTLQSSGSDYDTYKPSRAGYVFTSSYLRVPKSSGGSLTIPLSATTGTSSGESAGCAQIEFPSSHPWSTVRFTLGDSINGGEIGVRRLSSYSTSANFSYNTDYNISGKKFKVSIYANSSKTYGGRWVNVHLS